MMFNKEAFKKIREENKCLTDTIKGLRQERTQHGKEASAAHAKLKEYQQRANRGLVPDSSEESRGYTAEFNKAQAEACRTHWRKMGYREEARCVLLAMAFAKGMPYKKVEQKVREGHEPDINGIVTALEQAGFDIYNIQWEISDWLEGKNAAGASKEAA